MTLDTEAPGCSLNGDWPRMPSPDCECRWGAPELVFCSGIQQGDLGCRTEPTQTVGTHWPEGAADGERAMGAPLSSQGPEVRWRGGGGAHTTCPAP